MKVWIQKSLFFVLWWSGFFFPPQVTLLHVKWDQPVMSTHSFRVDTSVKNVTLHISGILTECMLTSPSGNNTALPTLGNWHEQLIEAILILNYSPVFLYHSCLCFFCWNKLSCWSSSFFRPSSISVEWARPSGRDGALRGSVSHQPALSYPVRPVETARQERRTPHIQCNR